MKLNEAIVLARKGAGLTQEQLGKEVGYSRRTVVLWEKGVSSPNDQTISDIEKVTGRSLGAISAPSDSDEGGVGLMVVGRAAGGIWKEGTVTFKPYRMPVAPHSGYPAKAQRLWEIEGTSINKQAEEGQYLHGVNVMESGVSPEHGDLVMVRRMEHGMAEYTAKVLTIREGVKRLKPDSDDPDWQEEFTLTGDDSTEIEILDIIIGKYVPIGRARRA